MHLLISFGCASRPRVRSSLTLLQTVRQRAGFTLRVAMSESAVIAV